MVRSVKEVADFVHARLMGDGSVKLRGIASVSSASPGDLVFVEDEKNLAKAMQSKASAVIAGEFAAGKTSPKPLLIHPQPRLGFARAAQLFETRLESKPGVHPSAVVHASAKLSKSVSVAERVVIGEGVQIGEGTRIGAGCVVGANASVGRDCELYPNVTMYAGVRLGDRVIVHSGAVLGSDGFGYLRPRTTRRVEKFPQIGRLEIPADRTATATCSSD